MDEFIITKALIKTIYKRLFNVKIKNYENTSCIIFFYIKIKIFFSSLS